MNCSYLPKGFKPHRRLKERYEKIAQYLMEHPDATYSKVMKAVRTHVSPASFGRFRNRMKSVTKAMIAKNYRTKALSMPTSGFKTYNILAEGMIPVPIHFVRVLVNRINNNCNTNLELVEYKDSCNRERIEVRKRV